MQKIPKISTAILVAFIVLVSSSLDSQAQHRHRSRRQASGPSSFCTADNLRYQNLRTNLGSEMRCARAMSLGSGEVTHNGPIFLGPYEENSPTNCQMNPYDDLMVFWGRHPHARQWALWVVTHDSVHIYNPRPWFERGATDSDTVVIQIPGAMREPSSASTHRGDTSAATDACFRIQAHHLSAMPNPPADPRIGQHNPRGSSVINEIRCEAIAASERSHMQILSPADSLDNGTRQYVRRRIALEASSLGERETEQTRLAAESADCRNVLRGILNLSRGRHRGEYVSPPSDQPDDGEAPAE